MKYLFICLLVLGAGLVGCNKGPNTGFKCRDCGHGIAESAEACPYCGSTEKPVGPKETNEGPFKYTLF